MTTTEYELMMVRLLCCSANYADKISTNLQYGACDESVKLIIINGLIELLEYYDVQVDSENCMTEEQFEYAVNKAKNICSLCDCE